MLTDKTMARLAEDCGWEFYEMFHLHGEDYGPCWLGDGVIRAVRLEDNKNTLTDAGFWQASKKLLLNPYPLAGGKIWKVALPAGYPALSLADSTPEAALMLAIQEVYA